MMVRVFLLLRVGALACVLVALTVAVARIGPVLERACRTELGACAQHGLPPCDRRLGPWQVARSAASGLPARRSNSACVLRDTGRATPVVAIVPQAPGMSGDTLLSQRVAARRERQHAGVTLAIHGVVPDHWDFAVAGGFLDVDTGSVCSELSFTLPKNTGYALIGGNWEARLHGFYFERLVDACVYDGTRAACGGDAPFIAHEFTTGEVFALDLELRRDGDVWWLDAAVALVEPDPATADGTRRRALGRMRRTVDAPCWLAPDDPGRALVLVIPDHQAAAQVPAARVEVFDFAWRE